jgi:hypothetical protein
MNTNLLLTAKIGFAILTIICAWILLKELNLGISKSNLTEQAKKKTSNVILIGLVVWLLLMSIWSLSGMMTDFTMFPFNFAPVLFVPLTFVIASLFSKKLSVILQNIPQQNLVRLQLFRFPVELLLWALFAAQALPEQMTFEGRNFDILAGITAPIIAWLISRNKISRTGLIIWNLAGMATLINIVTIAMLSTPTPIRTFMNEPANTIVGHFPVSWLPAFLVPLAYTLHFYSLKKLFATNKSLAAA